MDWPSAFVTSAVVMALLTWVWAFYATDRPAEHRHVNAAERRRIESAAELAGPSKERESSNWRDLLRNRSLLFLTLSYAAVGYFQYLFDYWMQYYFDRVLHLGGTASKYYASIPQLALALTMPLGGGLADGLARRVGLGRGRALVSGIGMLLSAGMLGLGVLAREPVWIVIWFTLAMGALGASEGPFWATAVELGGRRGGTAAAILNTGGNLGGVLAPVLTPWVSGHLGWPWGISLGGIICFLGALCWLRIDPDQRNRQTTIKAR
jgi:ACS family glucarate transporter-like MFS transporter